MSPTQMLPGFSFSSILDDKFSATVANEDFSFLRALKALHPGEHTRHIALLDIAEYNFPISSYLNLRGIEVEILDEPRHELVYWNALAGVGSVAGLRDFIHAEPIAVGESTERGRLVPRLITGAVKFKYNGTDFLVYKITWRDGHAQKVTLFDVVFEDPENIAGARDADGRAIMKSAGHNLISDIYRWAGSLKDEIWVFQNGCWMKDQALWAAIRSASWDDMVLEKEFLEGLRRDTRTFFENSKIYHELGVVWKRGLLLLGPPGNGKTETIKVLLKESGQAALYVKSFSTPAGPEAGVRSIFNHARENAPCILVIEDLDSLVTPDVRSFFLNELDGLGQNEGILTIATTNHPERIDDAILNRPSRFDVKYDFALPTEALRNAYALKWIRKIASLSTSAETQADSGSKTTVTFEKDEMELAEEVAKKTGGWSFAFLKELFISFLLRLAHDKAHSLAQGKTPTSSTTADADLMEQITSLSSQILPTNTSADGATAREHTGSSGNMAMGAGMMGHMYAMPAFRRPAQSLFYPSGNF